MSLKEKYEEAKEKGKVLRAKIKTLLDSVGNYKKKMEDEHEALLKERDRLLKLL